MDVQRNGMAVEPGGVGPLLRRWRESRHMSQSSSWRWRRKFPPAISASLKPGPSPAEPSREMLLTLSNVLDVPLRERNFLLLAEATRQFTARPVWTIRG